jgi:hypothetical protein
VLSSYAPSFQRINQWRKQAQYETVRGEICGFKLANDDAGELELVLYYGKDAPQFVRARFQGLFEVILFTRNVAVNKYGVVKKQVPVCSGQYKRPNGGMAEPFPAPMRKAEDLKNSPAAYVCKEPGRLLTHV